MRNGLPNLPDSNVPKGSAHWESNQHYSRNPQIGTCNWRILKICEKIQGDAPKGYKLQLLAIVFNINWNSLISCISNATPKTPLYHPTI